MGCKNKDTRPLKQQILMVINRLPFFAVRNGDDSWSLETSSGGLVNALLGKREKSMLSDLEKACADKIAAAEVSLKKKKQAYNPLLDIHISLLDVFWGIFLPK
ncbi:uncharacterized protein LOC131243506 [Magnolia sinica]|uniref:uncharacterized protein LOC131243506 n=1 Tax=Magnolia sinica TaxID=86752 RepID=UPI002659D3E6|nr:uncharacterized protein LOC131243506 [Magnolia sinica]